MLSDGKETSRREGPFVGICPDWYLDDGGTYCGATKTNKPVDCNGKNFFGCADYWKSRIADDSLVRDCLHRNRNDVNALCSANYPSVLPCKMRRENGGCGYASK